MLVPLTAEPAAGADPPAGAVAVPCAGAPVAGAVDVDEHPAKATAIASSTISPKPKVVGFINTHPVTVLSVV